MSRIFWKLHFSLLGDTTIGMKGELRDNARGRESERGRDIEREGRERERDKESERERGRGREGESGEI